METESTETCIHEEQLEGKGSKSKNKKQNKTLRRHRIIDG